MIRFAALSVRLTFSPALRSTARRAPGAALWLALCLILLGAAPATAQIPPEMQAWQTRKAIRALSASQVQGVTQAAQGKGAPRADRDAAKQTRELKDADLAPGSQRGLGEAAKAEEKGDAKAETGGLRIRVKPAACTVGPKVLLGEIATPAPGSDLALFAEAAKLPLWTAPFPARPLAIQKSKLKEYLKEALGDRAGQCELPNQLMLQTGGKVFLEDELRKMVDDFLTPRLNALAAAAPVAGEGGAAVERRDLKLPAYIFLAEPGDTLELQAVAEVKAGRVGLKFLAKNPQGKIYRQSAAGLFVDLWGTIPVTAGPINSGVMLTPDLVTFERKNLAFLKGKAWDGKGGPYRAKRTMGAGQPLLEDDLQTPPLVAKGDKVTLIYEGKNVQLQAPAEALADARAGEKVQVKNLLSQKEIVALVRDAQTVVVK